jgi:hypothetical protein
VVTARPDPAGRARGRVRRAVVAGPRDDLREHDREDDLARRLGVRAAARLRPEGDEEERAEVSRHAVDDLIPPGERGEDGRAGG